MRIGLHLGNKGPQASRALLAECARIADELPIDDLWVFDHLAIPPDQAEGSDGLYVEPLATLAFVAGITERVGLGTRVLILPYRPALLTAKWVASIQMLSGGRLRLGAGVGWMAEEFAALGVPRARRGALTDETLALLHRCFEDDEVEVNGQKFLFRPRPQRPPIYIGGSGRHAFARVVRYGDGWMPTAAATDALRAPIEELRRLMAEAGRPAPEVVAQLRLANEGDDIARGDIDGLAEIGVTAVAVNAPHETAGEFRRAAESLARAAGR